MINLAHTKLKVVIYFYEASSNCLLYFSNVDVVRNELAIISHFRNHVEIVINLFYAKQQHPRRRGTSHIAMGYQAHVLKAIIVNAKCG